MAAAGNDVQGMFSNDIVGTGDAHDGTQPNPFTVRMFLAGIPAGVICAVVLGPWPRTTAIEAPHSPPSIPG